MAMRGTAARPAEVMTGLSAALWGFLLFVMLSGGLVRAIVVLHEQDDSSLLLSSPISPRAVLAARLFGNALQSCLVDGFIIVPYLDVLIFGYGQWEFVWGFAVWFALAVVVTCLDGLFSFGMIRWFGLRRARMLSQAVPFILIFAVTFGAGSLSLSIAKANTAGGGHGLPPAIQDRFAALAHSPLAPLARAGTGSPLDLLALLLVTALLAWVTLRLTERAFVSGTQDVAENAAPPDHPARRPVPLAPAPARGGEERADRRAHTDDGGPMPRAGPHPGRHRVRARARQPRRGALVLRHLHGRRAFRHVHTSPPARWRKPTTCFAWRRGRCCFFALAR